MTESDYFKDLIKYKQIIIKARVPDILCLSPELIDNLADYCVLGKNHKVSYNHSSLFYIINSLLAALCNVVCNIFFYRFTRFIRSPQYIFIKSPSTFNRFGKLSFAIGKSAVCTLPIFDIKGIHKRFVKEIKDSSNPILLLLSVKDLINYVCFILKNIKLLYNIGNNREYVDADYNPNKFLLVCILKYLACYRTLLQLRHILEDSQPSIITDHDKTPIVLALKHIREVYHLNFNIITINHGAFSGFNLYYINPYSDIIMCTCLREVELTKKYSAKCRVYSYGIQLSTFIDDEHYNIINSKYDLLILGTITDGNLGRIQLELLKYLKKTGINFKYRLRPDSATKDKQFLSYILSDNDYTNRTTLLEDCASSKRIISFSLDALGRAVILNKQVAIFVDKHIFSDFSPIGNRSDEVFVTDDINEIIKFINKKENITNVYSAITKQWIYNNIGELSFEKIVMNIKAHI